MTFRQPFDRAKVQQSAEYVASSVAKEPITYWVEAMSHWHAANIGPMARELKLRKNLENKYWGSLIVSPSYLMWGSEELCAYTIWGLPLDMIDFIGVTPDSRPTPVPHPPPRDYHLLMLGASWRDTPSRAFGFPGGITPDGCSVVIDGGTVLWGFAIPGGRSGAFMDAIGSNLSAGEHGYWEHHQSGDERGLTRVGGLPDTGPGGADEFTLMDSIIDEMIADGAFTTRSADEVELVFCGQCGVRNPASSNFCAKCGSKLVKL